MKKLIRKWLGIEEPYPEAQRPMAHDVLEGSEMALVAYRIDNGYLLRVSGQRALQIGGAARLIYCTDEKDMADKIIAHRAFHKVVGGADLHTTANMY